LNSLNILVIIPARGGSKGILGKNIYPLAGKPLITHTIEQALASSLINLGVVVTTDDPMISNVSRNSGAMVIHRPNEISGDIASSESALIHALHNLPKEIRGSLDLVVFLQCTSPLRRPEDIDGAIRLILKEEADSLLSVSVSHRFLWSEKSGTAKAINYDVLNRPRRQDMVPQYVENGSIYIFRPQNLLDTGNRLSGKIVLYKMDEYAAIDIDSALDMKLAEMILNERSDEFYGSS
jgi:N-acylneuraminate cytidylyltransferase